MVVFTQLTKVVYKTLWLVLCFTSYSCISISLRLLFSKPKDNLIIAAREGNFDEVKRLINIGYDIGLRNYGHDLTALDWAAYCGHYDVVKYLIKEGAKINEPSPSHGFTPLMQTNNVKIAQLLIDNGAQTNYSTKVGSTPLILAVYFNKTCDQRDHYCNKISVLDEMFSENWDKTISYYDEDLVELLLKNGADKTINYQDERGYTALIYACRCDSPKVVKWLLEAGADSNIINPAAYREEIKTLLIQYGAKAAGR